MCTPTNTVSGAGNITPSWGGTAADDYYKKQQELIKARQASNARTSDSVWKKNFTAVDSLQLGTLGAPADSAAPIVSNSAYDRVPGAKTGFASLRIDRSA